MADDKSRPRNIQRPGGSTEEAETSTYRVKEGQVWGTNPELVAGDTVELTEAEAAGFEDKLEPVGGKAKAAADARAAAEPKEEPPAGAAPKKPNG